MMLATNAGTFLNAASRVSISSGILLRRDHEHGDCERKRRIDESFQPRHRNATQAKSA
jgi:hypothetical protein